jgi:glutaredoxin
VSRWSKLLSRGGDRREIVLYGKADCHLCEEMKAVVERVASKRGLLIREVDVTTNPELERRYGGEIPLLFIDGRKAFKYRVTDEALIQRLGRRLLR